MMSSSPEACGQDGDQGPLSPVSRRKKSERCWMKVVAVEFLQTNPHDSEAGVLVV